MKRGEVSAYPRGSLPNLIVPLSMQSGHFWRHPEVLASDE